VISAAHEEEEEEGNPISDRRIAYNNHMIYSIEGRIDSVLANHPVVSLSSVVNCP
jgi:hypothetical protein